MSAFETISGDEFDSAMASDPAKPKGRSKTKTDPLDPSVPRSRTAWFAMPTQLGECNLLSHLHVMESLGMTAQEMRRRYPIRMVYRVSDDVYMCRDCYYAEGDRDQTN